jgi:hypothetical protein
LAFQTRDGVDSFAQVFVREAHGIPRLEVSHGNALRSRVGPGLGVLRGSTAMAA